MSLESRPKNYTDIGDCVMSNCDHLIDHTTADKLKQSKHWSQYAGWNFCGYVWWNKDKWSCEVWQYHEHVDTIHGDTLQDIMDEVSVEYGYQ